MSGGSAAAPAIAGNTACMLRSDQPLREQTELNAAVRDKIVRAKREIDEMTADWHRLFEAKMKELEKAGTVKRQCLGFSQWKTIHLDFYDSVLNSKDLVIQCFDAIRADAAADPTMVLPWLECMPRGVMSCLPLKGYVLEWIAEGEVLKQAKPAESVVIILDDD